MKTLTVLCSTLISAILGHIQLINPYPIRSPLNPKLPSSAKDYSYGSPLSASGADFPCKGYAHDPFDSVADYTAGGQYSLTLDGTARHGGGSCQIALSYDHGVTFQVVKSILGHCPEEMTYAFQIPVDAPDGPAILAWTWFNKIGNREMYMNCAHVTVHRNATAGRDEYHTEADRPNSMRWADRPTIFIANIDAEGQCTTVEMEGVNFPQPGPDVEGSLSGGGFHCAEAAAFLGGGGDRPRTSTPLYMMPTSIMPTSTIGHVPSPTGEAGSHTSIITTALSDAAVNSPGGINVINHLDSSVHVWSFTHKHDPGVVIPACGGSYFEEWETHDDGGGISIKLALEGREENVLQIKYSLWSSIPYRELSFIDLHQKWDFLAHGIQVATDEHACPGLSCVPGDQVCSSMFLKPGSDSEVYRCLMQTNLTLSIGTEHK